MDGIPTISISPHGLHKWWIIQQFVKKCVYLEVLDLFEIVSQLHQIKYLWCNSYIFSLVSSRQCRRHRTIARKQERFNFRLNFIQKFMKCVMEVKNKSFERTTAKVLSFNKICIFRSSIVLDVFYVWCCKGLHNCLWSSIHAPFKGCCWRCQAAVTEIRTRRGPECWRADIAAEGKGRTRARGKGLLSQTWDKGQGFCRKVPTSICSSQP